MQQCQLQKLQCAHFLGTNFALCLDGKYNHHKTVQKLFLQQVQSCIKARYVV